MRKDSNFNLLPPWKLCSKQQYFQTQLAAELHHLTCLYFTFTYSSYTKHTFMVDRTGFKPAINLPCKGSGFDHSHHRPIKISFTHQSCLHASHLVCLLLQTHETFMLFSYWTKITRHILAFMD